MVYICVHIQFQITLCKQINPRCFLSKFGNPRTNEQAKVVQKQNYENQHVKSPSDESNVRTNPDGTLGHKRPEADSTL